MAVVPPLMGRDVTRVVWRCESAKEYKKLDLSGCLLMQVPEAIFLLMRNTTLTSCDLSKNTIRRIPSKLGVRFAQLTALNLCNNELYTLPEELKELNNLKVLDISHNNFSLLPRVVTKISTLTKVDAAHNIITEIEVDKLRVMPALKEANFKENPLPQYLYKLLKDVTEITIHLSDPEDSLNELD